LLENIILQNHFRIKGGAISMKLCKSFAIYVMFFAAISFFACDGGGGGSSGGDVGTGTVSVGLTDSTTDEYLAVYVTVADVQICKNDTEDLSDDCNWKPLETENDEPLPNRTYNLLKLVNGVTEAIGSNDFSEGIYHQIRLIIGDTPELENNLLGEPHEFANYLILNDGSNTIEQLKIPSGFQTGIKLVHQFEVLDRGTKELVLDFDAGRSVVKAGNSGKYILKPTIKVIEPEDKVEIAGMVTDDSDPVGGASVSAQISDGLSATVVRSTTTDGIDTENDFVEGEYILSLLSPDQIYNIVAYTAEYSPACTAYRDYDPDSEFPILPLDFELSVPDLGLVKVSGEVSVDGEISSDFPLIITIFTDLECNHPEGEGYVELTEVTDISQNSEGEFEYQIDLPKYGSTVTYYVVASSEGYIPYTGMAEILEENEEITVEQLNIRLDE
jgi:hypothetical protein